MAQYNFVSPGAAAQQAIEQLLVQRQVQARQRMLDEIQRKNTESQIEDRAMNRQIQQANLDTLSTQRAAMEDERRANIGTRVAGMLSPDQPLDADTSGALRDAKLGALITPGQEQGGVLPAEMGEGPTIEQGPETFRGTAAQLKTVDDRKRAEQFLSTLDPSSREAQALRYEINTGKAAPAGMFDKQQTSPDITEYEYYVDQTKKAGGAPISFQDWQKQAANLKNPTNAGGGQPYYIPVTTGSGIKPFNARTGKFLEDGRQDLRPSATAEENITKAQSTLYLLDQIGQQFTPDRVGPLVGRYKTMQLALQGEAGDKGLADMQSTVSALKNTVINLRTGAQMSEPEAQRILQEVPDFNLPPDVFVARMNTAKRYFSDYLSKRAKLAFGRTTAGDVDQMVTPALGHTPGETAPASLAAAPVAPVRRKYNPATGKVE